MADPDLQIRGVRSPRTWDKGGGRVSKNFSRRLVYKKGGVSLPWIRHCWFTGRLPYKKGWGCFSSSHLRHLLKILVPGDLWCSISSWLYYTNGEGRGGGEEEEWEDLLSLLLLHENICYRVFHYNISRFFVIFQCYSIIPLRLPIIFKAENGITVRNGK